ncbi:SDR family oxidoreductase [Nocardia sp. NBC_00565]|uniref:SDR family NAD(P)-dependent oxidoreductase n=1 Tax=Nocardia sp. NBC_00565 TaxID=2975993 RepID=UPI002E80439E|nr:SDR family oxidoreductase [Nocardia sp. NBC_00565]WUC02495.1 SDR family oxidoreductase [Nocardia sp. NBC_00565]
MNRFAQRRVLVTGAGSGIGRAIVLRLLVEGATVVGVSRTDDGLTKTEQLALDQGLGDRLTVAVLDISDEPAVAHTIPAAIAGIGGLDVLVNAAGIVRMSHTHETSTEVWNSVLGTNLTGSFLVTRTALPALLDSGRGVVVNISSNAASYAAPYRAAYAASKGGLEAFTRVLALEYSKRNLRAVCVSPGGIETAMTYSLLDVPPDIDPSLLSKMAPAIGPLLGSPEMVAGVVAMVASDDGEFMTGTTIHVDGGAHV